MDEQLLRELDQLHVDKQWSQAYEKAKSLLDAAASDSVETDLPADCLFRCARTLYNYAKFVVPAESKKETYAKGLRFAERAIEGGANEGHLWFSALKDAVAEQDGYRQRLEASKDVGDHLKTAVQLMPDNPHAHHALAKYYFAIADLPWIFQGVVRLLFGSDTLSSCTHEMALEHFLKADQLSSDFYSVNTLHIGKSYLRLQKSSEAVPYLEKASQWAAKCSEDEEVRKEASELLNDLVDEQDDY